MVPGQGSTVVVTGSGATPVDTGTGPRTYLGISANYAFGNTFSTSALRYTATLGTTRLLGGLGGRVNFEYQPSTAAFGGDVNLTYNLGEGTLAPYLGLGAGVTYSSNNPAFTTSGDYLDYYANGIVGVDYRFTDSIGLFAEANPRYYFSNNGSGTGLAASASGGFGIGVRAGLKFSF